MLHIKQLREENHKLMAELVEALAENDEQQITIIHDMMMSNKELMLKIEAFEENDVKEYN